MLVVELQKEKEASKSALCALCEMWDILSPLVPTADAANRNQIPYNKIPATEILSKGA